MKFQGVFRASFYAMLTCATLVLSIDATDDNPIALLYPLAVAAAGLFALVAVDRDPAMGLTRGMGNALAIASPSLSYLEYKYDDTLTLLALGHWLVYLQLIKMCMPKTVEDDWFLMLLGLVQVLIGGVMSQSDQVGMALFSWAILALWVLGLFSLHRDALRVRPAAGTAVTPRADPAEPYPGLIDGPFVFASIRVAATTLALGSLIFLAVPRQASLGGAVKGQPMTKHLTGFDDEVQLGQLGEILENDSIVMSVELYNEANDRVAPPVDEPLWRGVTMAAYQRGHWKRQARQNGTVAQDLPRRQRVKIRQLIKLEPTDSGVLFAMRPILAVSVPSRRIAPEINKVDGTLSREMVRPGAFDYEVVSGMEADTPQPGESYPAGLELEGYLGISDAMKGRLGALAEPVVAALDPEDRVARARALESWLRDSGAFSYSLQMDGVDAKLDPVEDFLVNRRRGHCEYFASALALLLRSVDIPCRMVNGFKGGDWNDLARVLNVRQKHAHSWVEVLGPVDPAFPTVPTWITLDPTPSGEREASVAKVGGFAGNFREISDFIRYVWVFYVVGFNSERQERLLYKPFLQLVAEAKRGFAIMGQAIRGAAAWLTNFPDVDSFFSVRGLIVSFVLLLAAALAARLLAWLARRIYRGLRGGGRVGSAQAIGVAFYKRMAQALAGYGLDRPPAETPREFARRAALFLSGRGSSAIADVPALVVDAFYSVRYGHNDLDADHLLRLEARLDALEAGLKSPPA